MRRLLLLCLVLIPFASVVLAASSTSFCKCTCFSNSTLIQLTGHKSGDSDGKKTENGRLVKAGTCDDCNRQFCLSQSLPMCKLAEEADVFTTCFQRDSAKDEAVVFIFIFATVGLLIWAAIRPYFERWMEQAKDRRSYAPVPEDTTQ